MSNRYNVGSLKTLNISPYVHEQTVPSIQPPTAISTGSPQMSVTFSNANMKPTFSGNAGVVSYRASFGANLSGQNTSGASVTLYYQINKNGSSWKTGNTSISNNNYYTLSFIDQSTNDGDKYDLYIWTSATSGMNYFYQNYYVLPGRIDTGAKYLMNFSATITGIANSTYFPLTGQAGSSWYGGIYFQAATDTNIGSGELYTANNTTPKTYTFPLLASNSVTKLFYLQGGEATTGIQLANAGNYPQMQINDIISTISYREIFFR